MVRLNQHFALFVYSLHSIEDPLFEILVLGAMHPIFRADLTLQWKVTALRFLEHMKKMTSICGAKHEHTIVIMRNQ